MNIYDVAIVGAGPAGLMAAISASESGKSVLLIEKNEILGRKILATGNGRCNLTNRNIDIKRYHGLNKYFIQNIIERFDQFETIDFFEKQGVVLKEEDRGRIFPRSNQASTIVNALKHKLEELETVVRTNETVKKVEKDEIFTVKTEGENTYYAKNVILTTGGKAAHQLGSSGDGIFWAKNFGHNIIPIYAALVPIETKENWVKDIQGIKIEAKITSKIDNEKIKETFGDVLFTHFGLSGPAIMAQGGAISPFVENKDVSIILDLYPELNDLELDKKLEGLFKSNSKKSVKNALLGLFPSNLMPVILKESEIDIDKKTAEISKADRRKILLTIKNLELRVEKVRPLKEAQVSRGGVNTNEVDENTLESKIIKGLYFAGEILDVDGDSGGFNLQWAWSSGYIAGKKLHF